MLFFRTSKQSKCSSRKDETGANEYEVETTYNQPSLGQHIRQSANRPEEIRKSPPQPATSMKTNGSLEHLRDESCKSSKLIESKLCESSRPPYLVPESWSHTGWLVFLKILDPSYLCRDHKANKHVRPDRGKHSLFVRTELPSDEIRAMESTRTKCTNQSRTSRTRRVKDEIQLKKVSYLGPLFAICMLICLTTDDAPPERGIRWHQSSSRSILYLPLITSVEASLIIGDSAIEIQEVDSNGNQQQQQQQPQSQSQAQNDQSQVGGGGSDGPSIILGSTSEMPTSSASSGLSQPLVNGAQNIAHIDEQQQTRKQNVANLQMPGPLPPLSGSGDGQRTDDITDGDKKSRDNHDYVILNDRPNSSPNEEEKRELSNILSARPNSVDDEESKAIAGKVVDFELTPAGGHNKAKIKKKKKKKKKAEEEKFKKWGKKKKFEKKAMEKKHKEGMKKKKEEGKKKKKKWGLEEHGQKKKGKFKKKKWGKKVKKGKGVKKGKKGKKFLKDKGHKNTGFKTVYHKEEYGTSKKWHDIKREKKWDEKSKKWKKKWKKEKGKKYKGDHMKKFEKKKKSGKKYDKEKKDKFKKFKKEEFEKGKKKKMEEHGKKKEGGAKKEKKEMKKKKKKKKG